MGIQQLNAKTDGEKKLLPKKPKQENSEELFSDYGFPSPMEETLWMAAGQEHSAMMTMALAIVDEKNDFDSVWDVNVEVNDASTTPYAGYLIAENKNISERCSFEREENENLNDCWGNGYHAFGAVMGKDTEVDCNNTVNKGNDVDIVLSALGESGLHEFLIETPVQDTNTDHKLTVRRKVGRPERKTPLEIPEVPKASSNNLTPDQIRSLKFRRMRNLNNEASKRFRMSRQKKQSMQEEECKEIEYKNLILKEKLLAMESEVGAWKARVFAIGYNI